MSVLTITVPSSGSVSAASGASAGATGANTAGSRPLKATSRSMVPVTDS